MDMLKKGGVPPELMALQGADGGEGAGGASQEGTNINNYKYLKNINYKLMHYHN